jgi:hypothetical protein
MNIYILKSDANMYENLVLSNDSDWAITQRFNGNPLSNDWTPLKVKVFRDKNSSRELLPSDFPMLATHIPVFSKRAINELYYFLKPNGEILEIKSESLVYFAYNVTTVVDALDVEQCGILRTLQDELIDIKKYSFKISKTGLPAVFKVPQLRLMDVFVTDIFKYRVQEAKLSGFSFKAVATL